MAINYRVIINYKNWRIHTVKHIYAQIQQIYIVEVLKQLQFTQLALKVLFRFILKNNKIKKINFF